MTMTTPATTPADGELLPCPHCRAPKTRNPHPNAGKPEHLAEAGYLYECIACLARTRNGWATRALAAEKRLTELERATPSPGKAEAEDAALRTAIDSLNGWIGANAPGGWIDDLRSDAERWQMLPAFFEEYQINALKLFRDIDAAIQQGRDK